MGQLEKYGLYVLCLVIFLILGVTIWGNPAVAAPGQRNEPVAIRVHAGGATLGVDALPVNARSNRNDAQAGGGGIGMIDSLLSPVKVQSPPRKISGPEVKKPIDNSPSIGQLLDGDGSGVIHQEQETPKPTPVVAATREYKVESGDTLGGIAEKHLGSTRYIDRIRAVNKGLTDDLSIGQVLILPMSVSSGATASKTETSALSGHRTYTINKNDTFEGIAKRELRSTARVKEIVALNPNVDPRLLQLGAKIRLPAQ